MISIWMTYFIAAAAASCVFIAAGWRSRRILNAYSPNDGYELPIDPLWGEATSDQAASQAQSDAESAVRLALKRLGPLLKSQSVQADIAIAPNLLVRMRVSALADLVEELLGAAIHAAPASRLLLTASAQGDHVEIATTDDVPGADPAIRTARMRGLTERVAIRGGALNILVRPSEGTTMTLRLAAGVERRASTRETSRGSPRGGWMNDRRTVEP